MAKSVYEQSGYRYRRYQKPSSARKKKLAVAAVVLAALLAAFLCMAAGAAGILRSVSGAAVRAAIQSSFNQALAETLEWNAVDYDSLVRIERDGEGNILGIEAACAQGVGVPLGAFTGIDWLAGYGPRVTLRILPVGRVQCEYASVFASAGVNQTLHSVSLQARAAVEVVLPGGSEEIEGQVSALVCENVIVGKVPDIYLQGAGSLSASSA